jgi:hypothetical protein
MVYPLGSPPPPSLNTIARDAPPTSEQEESIKSRLFVSAVVPSNVVAVELVVQLGEFVVPLVALSLTVRFDPVLKNAS